MNKYMIMAAISVITLAGAANAEHHEGNAAHHAKMQAHFDKKFAEVDGNKDGKISMEEKMSYVKTEFNNHDKNRDGFIDKPEAMAAWHEKKNKMGTRIPAMGIKDGTTAPTVPHVPAPNMPPKQ
jgi:hypothetical protein